MLCLSTAEVLAMMARFLLLLALLLSGCAAPGPAPQQAGVVASRDAVLSGAPIFGVGPLPPLPEVDILALDQPMRDFLARFVDARARAPQKLHQLARAVVDEASFGLRYSDATRTAAETFAARDGNCLAFTNMFVAMARAVGLAVRFQQIDVPPDWVQRGDSFVLNRHINVLVDVGDRAPRTVDFNIEDLEADYEREVVSDARAQAHYYNNVGVERMQAGVLRDAFLHLRRGLQSDASFAPLWINLGALYQRANAPLFAEASYLEALRVDRADTVAISNLARLYQRLGDTERAAHYRELAARHRANNPYLRYHEARSAYFAHDYAKALEALDFAIRRKPAEDTFHYLRAKVRLQLGDEKRARADLERAVANASDETLARKYRAELDALLPERD